jgi:SAM-dependent methyltransferase
MEKFPEQAEKLTVEIACNDGTLLKNFANAGYPVLGVEPSGAALDAVDNQMQIMQAPFNSELATSLLGSAGLVLAFNVAAHVADPIDFLSGITTLLTSDGVAVVEFQDFAAFIAGCQFDHVYHEHRFFYSLTSFSRVAHECGLEIFDWEHTDAQGGSIRAYLRRGDSMVHVEPWLESIATYEGMQGRADFAKHRLRSLIADEMSQGRVVAGYGASAKSATLFNFCGLDSHQISWVEDLTPYKIGRYTPGSHIPICNMGEIPDTYLLTSWNYLSAVLKKEAKFLTKGKLIVPSAVPSLL